MKVHDVHGKSKKIDKPHTFQDLGAFNLRRMTDLPNWVGWIWELKANGKFTKPPIIADARSLKAATDRKNTWRPYPVALETAKAGHVDGIGFVLYETGVGAFDIDCCRDAVTGEIHPWAMDLVKHAKSYAEVTVSGTGVRILGLTGTRYLNSRQAVPGTPIFVECYRGAVSRYVTVSGLHIKGTPNKLNNIDKLLDEIHAELGAKAAPPPDAASSNSAAGEEASSDETLRIIEMLLPDDLRDLVCNDVEVGKRSEVFHHAVRYLKDLQWSLADIIKLLEKYPEGIANRYTNEGRLAEEARRAYEKPDSKKDDEEEEEEPPPSGSRPPPQQKTPGMFWHGEPTGRALKPWLIKELIPQTGIGFASGQWGSCKTFSMLDLACCITTGLPFAGREVVRSGGVLFVAVEGGHEIESRLQGLVEHKLIPEADALKVTEHPITVDLDHLPFVWIEELPSLKGPKGFPRLLKIADAAAQRMKEKFGVELVLLIIDTLNAAADFSDQNDAAEAQKIMNGLNALSTATGAFVLAVDHFGKSVETGTRGSSAKEASADMVLALLAERDVAGAISNTRMAVRKLRGGKTGAETPFDLKVVEIVDPTTEADATTCIIEWKKTRGAGDATSKSARVPKGLKVFHAAMRNAVAEHGKRLHPFGPTSPKLLVVEAKHVREEFIASYPADAEAKKKAYSRALKDALSSGLVVSREIYGVDHLWLPNEQASI